MFILNYGNQGVTPDCRIIPDELLFGLVDVKLVKSATGLRVRVVDGPDELLEFLSALAVIEA